jgi:two-component system, cell cycle sensor histidine kinase and response regulator CckA
MGNPLRLTNPIHVLDADLLTAAFDNNPEGLAIADQERIIYANPALGDLFAYADPREMHGKTLASFRPAGYRCPRASRRCTSAGRSAPPFCEFQCSRKDGGTIRIESSCSDFQANGRDLVVLTIRDTSQRERRRIVRDSDRRFRTIFKAAPIGIVQCASDGRVLETNPAVERMLGYSRDESRPVYFRDYLHPEDRETDSRLFNELAKGERETYEHDVRYIGRVDSGGWMHLKVSLVRGLREEPQFAIAMIADITERKRTEERLRDAQKMEAVGTLVGGVAHDFNNLLTGIMLCCDLLRAGLDPGSNLHHHAEEIPMAGEQGAALIQQLLAFSRQQPIEPRILCLNQIVNNSRNLLSRLIGEKIELKFELDAKLGNIKMDPAQVQQVFFNLVLNGRDAIADSGSITVETRNCAFLPDEPTLPSAAIQGLMLSVTDSGCGMSAETRSRLFEPFFTTKTAGRGNGLGLATAYNIVKGVGGGIEVESEVGKGTTFPVLLPRIVDLSVTSVPEGLFSPVPANETILLVEDNAAVRRAARRILSECGYRVLEAGDGIEALAIERKSSGTIDLLLVDLMMPGIRGRDLARQMLESNPAMRVLYMSGYEPQGTEQSDPTVFYRKPFTGAALLKRVREVLDTYSPAISKTGQDGK